MILRLVGNRGGSHEHGKTGHAEDEISADGVVKFQSTIRDV